MRVSAKVGDLGDCDENPFLFEEPGEFDDYGSYSVFNNNIFKDFKGAVATAEDASGNVLAGQHFRFIDPRQGVVEKGTPTPKGCSLQRTMRARAERAR